MSKFYLQGENGLLIFTETEKTSRLAEEVEERNNQLQTIGNVVAFENLKLKARVAIVEAENSEVKKRIINTESKLPDVEKLIRERPAELCWHYFPFSFLKRNSRYISALSYFIRDLVPPKNAHLRLKLVEIEVDICAECIGGLCKRQIILKTEANFCLE